MIRCPSWVTALAHELGHLMRRDENATPHEHRIAYRLGVWRARQVQREARTPRRVSRCCAGRPQVIAGGGK
jgi:hypothetical protein